MKKGRAIKTSVYLFKENSDFSFLCFGITVAKTEGIVRLNTNNNIVTFERGLNEEQDLTAFTAFNPNDPEEREYVRTNFLLIQKAIAIATRFLWAKADRFQVGVWQEELEWGKSENFAVDLENNLEKLKETSLRYYHYKRQPRGKLSERTAELWAASFRTLWMLIKSYLHNETLLLNQPTNYNQLQQNASNGKASTVHFINGKTMDF